MAMPLSALAQQLKATQSTIDCGQVVFMHPISTEFELLNSGKRPLHINEVRVSCGCTSTKVPQGDIAEGQHFKVSMTYDARQMGHFDKQVAIYTRGDKEPTILTLKGVVVEEMVDFSGTYPYDLGMFKADKNDVEFDEVNRGDRPVAKIHLMNTTDRTLQPQVMHLPAYISANVSPSKVAPGHTAVVSLTLDARRVHDFGLTQTSLYLGMFPGDKVSADKEITVSTVILPDFDRLTEQQRANAPELYLSSTNLDLGAFNTKSKLKGTIDIENKGRSTLYIRSLQMFTVGLQASLSKTHLAPGEHAKMKITALASGIRKARSKPRFLMITNDPDHSKVVITVNTK